MNQKQIKELIRATEVPCVTQLIVQVLMNHDSDLGSYDVEAGVQGYTVYVKRTLDVMKSQYQKMLKKETSVHQIDLEDSINEIKAEKYGKK